MVDLEDLKARALSFVGSMRDVQSPEVGGTSIQASRWEGCGWFGAGSREGLEVGLFRELDVGSEGPKSSSELLLSSASSGACRCGCEEAEGDEGGSSSIGAGGSVGPTVRWRFDVLSGLDERLLLVSSSLSASSSRFRFSRRCGGS